MNTRVRVDTKADRPCSGERPAARPSRPAHAGAAYGRGARERSRPHARQCLPASQGLAPRPSRRGGEERRVRDLPGRRRRRRGFRRGAAAARRAPSRGGSADRSHLRREARQSRGRRPAWAGRARPVRGSDAARREAGRRVPGSAHRGRCLRSPQGPRESARETGQEARDRGLLPRSVLRSRPGSGQGAPVARLSRRRPERRGRRVASPGLAGGRRGRGMGAVGASGT